jgi:hypothetical protein
LGGSHGNSERPSGGAAKQRDKLAPLHSTTSSASVFGPPIELAMAPLAPISLDLGHCHSRDADRIESIADVLELKRLDDGNDDLHRRTQSLTASPPRTAIR